MAVLVHLAAAQVDFSASITGYLTSVRSGDSQIPFAESSTSFPSVVETEPPVNSAILLALHWLYVAETVRISRLWRGLLEKANENNKYILTLYEKIDTASHYVCGAGHQRREWSVYPIITLQDPVWR